MFGSDVDKGSQELDRKPNPHLAFVDNKDPSTPKVATIIPSLTTVSVFDANKFLHDYQ